MPRPSLVELERRCQKPDHRLVGNWMARRITRPLALRVTRCMVDWPVSAHAMTCLAWLTGVAAAGCLAAGSVKAWLAAAVLLQLWYVLDHVDGQLARYHDTASLDGVQLDYLMHHSLNLLVPIGAGFGLSSKLANPWWLGIGIGWGMGLWILGMLPDTRYKAFVQRLKRVVGELQVKGGGGARPTPASPAPRSAARLLPWIARKACEPHVVMNLLTLVAIAQLLAGDQELWTAQAYVLAASIVALACAGAATVRSVRRGSAEREFAAWFQSADGFRLVLKNGWWQLEPLDDEVFTTEARRPRSEIGQTLL